jgi:hypothetical protein
MTRLGTIMGYENIWGNDLRQRIIYGAACVSTLLVAVTIPASYFCEKWFYWIYGFWVIAPPSWFFVEFFFVFGRRDDKHALDLFKMGQDVAQKFWAALLVLLTGIGHLRWHISLFH